MSPPALGFIGLGVMGYPMALNLLNKLETGTRLHVYDVSSQILDKSKSEAPNLVSICLSARDVAERSAVWKKSTMASFYDAPVSGGSLGAAAGTLTFMLGCNEDDPKLPLLKELLGAMGSSIFPCGGFSLGLTAKLCNNYCSGLIAIATAEALNIGIKSGMDPSLLARIFTTSTAQSTIKDKWNPVPGVCPNAPASRDYQGGFKVQLMKRISALLLRQPKGLVLSCILGRLGWLCITRRARM
ncbi:unnamed protein product [Penicillium egyptiacum]|uniref:3-hydroxyisobutyrate dehydrogenase n=1 Tax=Penicillium egyptiacum TaxID=1303716 RepID=A0A9W4KPJ6_9EURO|nr:unnamed protein product [Penicillium egyptiacum]